MDFNKPILIYLPCYNCREKIISTIKDIPASLHDNIECLVVDNDSQDGSSDAVLNEIKNNNFPFKVHLVKNNENLGYAGSQKVAYSIFLKSETPSHIIMLHGDGQYPPKFITALVEQTNSGYSIVNGFRCKKTYPEKEETPAFTYLFIKMMNFIESTLTGFKFKEWHSGFVMYSRDFLKEIPFQDLTKSMHLDGELLICAGALKKKVYSIPIHKRYKDHVAFAGLGRIKYILDVFKLIFKYKLGHHKTILKNKPKFINERFYTKLTD